MGASYRTIPLHNGFETPSITAKTLLNCNIDVVIDFGLPHSYNNDWVTRVIQMLVNFDKHLTGQ